MRPTSATGARRTPGQPATWSAWKWVSTSSGTAMTPRWSRQRSTACRVGAGVDDDGRAVSGVEHQRVALADVAHHDHPARRRPPAAGSRSSSRAHDQQPQPRSPPVPAGHHRRRASRTQPGVAWPVPGASRPGTPPPRAARIASDTEQAQRRQQGQAERPVGPGHGGAGKSAARVGDRDDPPGAPAADRPATRATGERTSQGATRSPSTVAGATAGAASRLAETATTLTWPEIAATRGVHTSCAASGTASASATQPRHPASQRVAPRRREQQDARGGEHRQREAGRKRQPRIAAAPARPPRRTALGVRVAGRLR